MLCFLHDMTPEQEKPNPCWAVSPILKNDSVTSCLKCGPMLQIGRVRTSPPYIAARNGCLYGEDLGSEQILSGDNQWWSSIIRPPN